MIIVKIFYIIFQINTYPLLFDALELPYIVIAGCTGKFSISFAVVLSSFATEQKCIYYFIKNIT